MLARVSRKMSGSSKNAKAMTGQRDRKVSALGIVQWRKYYASINSQRLLHMQVPLSRRQRGGILL